jgi:hypothetical protein
MRIFGVKRHEVTGDWRKLHNEELLDVYWSPTIARAINGEKIEMGGTCSVYGGEESCVHGFGGET